MKAILFLSAFFFSCSSYAATLSTALTLNGLQWAQLSDTSYLSVPGVYDACGNSGGTCAGFVDGKDLTGWRWASQNEVDTMVADLYGVGTSPTGFIDTTIWFDYFNWIGAEGQTVYTIGLASDYVSYSESDGVVLSGIPASKYVELHYEDVEGFIKGGITNFDPFEPTYYLSGFESAPYAYGFFMVKGDYAPPITSEVPLPASLFLFAPALLGLIGLRRKSS